MSALKSEPKVFYLNSIFITKQFENLKLFQGLPDIDQMSNLPSSDSSTNHQTGKLKRDKKSSNPLQQLPPGIQVN